MQNSSAPILVEIRRGRAVESSHQVHAVVANAEGVVSSWGNAERLTMPRSAIKAIQLLPMVALGAAAEFQVSDDEIALAASSHSGETVHTNAVEAWLERLEMSVEDLECGASDPINLEATHELYRRGGRPTSLHNCCSGKHTGFLTMAKYLQGDTRFELPGYLDPSHGVQQHVRDAQAMLTGTDLTEQTPAIDGCGIPVYEFPLHTLAAAMARLVTPSALPALFVSAAARVVKALPSRSLLVSGTDRADHVIALHATEPLILKGGAEGVSMAALPDRGLGLALKCEDGNSRGVDEAVAAVLHRLGALREPVSVTTPLRNRAGTEVGSATVVITEPNIS